MTVGQTVARARVTAGLTVEDVALATRVRGTVVSAIENDDFTLCGGDVYARGHLKSIATAVGLDPVAVATQFDAERGRSRAANSPVAPIEQPTRVMEITDKDTLGALASTLGTSVRMSMSWPKVGSRGSPTSETARSGQGLGLAWQKRRKSPAQSAGRITRLPWT